jgi:Kef-type K+ transport system membrane component KefB
MSNVLLVGLILVLALAGGHLVKFIRVPEVVGYFLIGLFLGPSFSQILSSETVTTLEFFSEIALGLILFSIGAVFEFENLRRVGKRILLLILYLMAGTVSAVFITLLALNGSWQVALLLGVIAVEVSPIATVLVMREANARGQLTDAVNNVLALNNVGCLIVFGLATFVVKLFDSTETTPSLASALGREFLLLVWNIAGSVALGIVLGYVLAHWGKQVEEHSEILILVLGMILIAVGASHWLGLSSLIATMTLGAALINLEKESRHLFEVLGKTDPPLYAIFFVLAGAHLQLSSLLLIGVSGVGYTLSRIAGKMAGAWYGAKKLGYPEVINKYLGVSLVAHAGVAIGLALQVRSIFPKYAEVIATVILGSVLINEVLGPVLTKLALTKAGETRVEHIGAFEGI